MGSKWTLKLLLCHKSSLKIFLLCKYPKWTTHLGDGVNNFSLALCVFFSLHTSPNLYLHLAKNIKTELRGKDWKGLLCLLLRYFPQRKSNSLIRWLIFLLLWDILPLTHSEYLNFRSGYLTYTTYIGVPMLYHWNLSIFILGWLCFSVASQNHCPFTAFSNPHPLLFCSEHLTAYWLPGSAMCCIRIQQHTQKGNIEHWNLFPLLQTDSVIRNRATQMLPGMYFLFQNMP